MCMIMLKPQGAKLPKKSHLENGALKNEDGMGLAYYKEGSKMVSINKTFDKFKDMWDFIEKNITEEHILVVHFRFATHGIVDQGNSHPFPVTKNEKVLRETSIDCEYAMAHNGVISHYNNRNNTDTLSDTQYFVKNILSDKSIKKNLDSPAIITLIKEFIGVDRLVVFNNKGRYWTLGEWYKEDDVFYSNAGYKNAPYKWTNNNIRNNFGYENWEKNNKPEEKSKVIKTDNGDYYHYGICDGCGKKKKNRFDDTTGKKLFLCKKCRKKARKGKLKNIEEYEVIRCDSCRTWVKEEDLVPFHSELICKKCAIESDIIEIVKTGK